MEYSRDSLCLLFYYCCCCCCLLFTSVHSSFTGLGDNVQTMCRFKCSFKLETDGDSYYCDDTCRIKQCEDGCSLYTEALTSQTCQGVCTDWLTQNASLPEQASSLLQIKKQSCIQGCAFGLDGYFASVFNVDVEDELSAPKLVMESKAYSSIELYWDGATEDGIENVTYFLQKQMTDLDTDWQMHNDTELLSSGNLLVTNLHPYVTYKFKLIFKVTSIHTLKTAESAPITTLPNGVPSSSPVVASINAPSATVISVSWTPPLLPNGPLLSYRLTLKALENPDLHQISNDVSAELTSWMFGHLHSGQSYELTIAAVNEEGEGPATSRIITTPNPGNLSETDMPYLILGADNMVVKQRLMELTREAEKVLTKPRSILITGVGVHVAKQLIVVSDDSGQVTLISLSGDNQVDNIYPALFEPTAINIDWLHNRAYVIDGQRIYQCTIKETGNHCLIAVDISPHRPREVKVDPINGYIYFTVINEAMPGLYRMDIGDISDFGHSTAKVLLDTHLETFNIDHENFLLYFPDNKKNTIMSAYLDGTGVQDMRRNLVARPYFLNINSMVYYDEKFFWTNGTKVFSEEYDAGNRTYYHNSLLLFEKHFRGFNMYYPQGQKVPAPINPPSDVQALFTAHKVIVQWGKPDNLQFQGKGAFSSWQYDVQITQDDGSKNVLQHTEETMKLEVSNLVPDTQYTVQVRAKSTTGDGPWSNVFIGRTLKDELDSVRLLVALPYQFGIWQIQEMDFEGKTPQTISETSPVYRGVTGVDGLLQSNTSSDYIQDMDWHKDMLFWTTKSGELFMHNSDDVESFQRLNFVKNAASLAFDWLGERLYWSVMKNGVIKRSDLYGSSVEFVYQALARDMVIDSVQGRLYWVTMNSVESSSLNGNEHLAYFSVPYFSGRYVISLTINQDMQKIFWYVKGFEDQTLYSADLVGSHGNKDVINTVQLVGDFEDIAKFSALKYFSHRLLWLDQDYRVTVGNLECNYTSTILDISDEVTDFTIKHPSLHAYPAGLTADTVRVIPDLIPASSIVCEGTWSHFNVTWQPASEVNHGKVAYELSIHGEDMMDVILVTEVTWQDLSGLPPFSSIVVSVRGYTHWGSGPLTTTTVRTPMSVPTQPQAPKVYVTQRKNAASSKLTLAADFRWQGPETINGILSHQHVYYWMSSNPGRRSSTTLPASSRHFILDGLEGNTTYYFQVESCTEVGCGPKSSVVNATADAVNPVPKLLIAKKNSIVLADADNIANSTDTMVTKSAFVMAFLAQDNRNFWISTDKWLEEYHMTSANKLLQIEGGVHDMSLDWISRTLYILVTNGSAAQILTYQLDQAQHVTLLQRPGTMGNIVVDPYTSTLLWSEQKSADDKWTLISSNVDGSNVTEMFLTDDQPRSKRAVDSPCNCPSAQRVSSALAMDLSQDGKTEVIFVDQRSVSLMAADVYGCRCRVLMTTTAADRKGLPPDHLTVDHVHVYWYNNTEQKLYALDKSTDTVSVTPLTDVNTILAYGSNLQPLPGSECLDMGAYNGSLEVTQYGNTSLVVSLDEMVWPESCLQISHPAVKYKVFYKKIEENNPSDNCVPEGLGCVIKSSYQGQITLDGLEPYTEYVLHAAVSNYYTEYSAATLREPVIVQTKSGVPSAVENLTVILVTPNRVQVSWPPPSNPNGPIDKIVYFVRWSAVMSDGVSKTSTSDAYTYDDFNDYSNQFSKVIDNLEADHTYSIQVLCNQTEGGYVVASKPVTVHTYLEPNDIELLDATNTSITLGWLSSCDDSTSTVFIYYAMLPDKGPPVYRSKMDTLPIQTENCTSYNDTFVGLQPNIEYTFRLNIIYKGIYQVYHWPRDTKDLKYVARTLTGIPGFSDPPVMEEFKTGEFEVTWAAPVDHGEPISHYILQYRQIDKKNWSLAHNTSDTRWVVDDRVLPRGYTYVFRVKAENLNGWGPLSLNSTLFSYPTIQAKTDDKKIIIAALVGGVLFIALIIAIIVVICLFIKRRRNGKKQKTRKFVLVPQGPDQELATLRELPLTAVQQINTLYSVNLIPTDDEIAALPHFRRNQLVLCKFLGSGAFGEVFEGLAKNIISNSSGDTKVAVKTLRKSASEQEKEEFLKEALLMSNFHHDNILSLLGVCLDNDPQFIILELMEGGDLLSFMRACRLSSIQNRAELSLTDLVKICVHVARGCKYLEDMHFVHRDLAARNCLVSSCNPSEMKVKIGDFGLARDIYKNDYYRKEGEGLLPVRWMSPESLVDGVFTTQSDIWAFGILMWEVVTFGQQPYPARTNIEVLHYVRSGGRLDRSDNCPDDFYQLMCKCWKFAPEDRPSFAYLLQQLEQFQETCASISEYLVPIRSSSAPIAADGYFNGMFDDVEEVGLVLWAVPRRHRPRFRHGTEGKKCTPPFPRSPKEVDGYVTRRRGRMTSTSSDGADYYGVNRSQYGSQKVYGKIRRATSFDSPEPKDATPHIQTDASNYMEPKQRTTPEYLKILSEAHTENYLYNSKGGRIRPKEDCEQVPPREPSYVQTTVHENPNYAENYTKHGQQKGLYGNTPVVNEQYYMKYIQQKGIPKSASKETISSIVSSTTAYHEQLRGHETIDEHEVFQDSKTAVNTSTLTVAKDTVTKETPVGCARKQRLDSSNSCMSFDSVQTEPAYHYSDFKPRNKLYSSSSSKSNYSLSNGSQQMECPSTPEASVQKGQPSWTINNNNNNNNNVNGTYSKCPVTMEISRGHGDYLHRGQVYPENAGILAGYDIVHASLV